MASDQAGDASAAGSSAAASQQAAEAEAASVANARAVLYVVALFVGSAIVTVAFDTKPSTAVQSVAICSLALFCAWHVIAKGSRHDRLFAAWFAASMVVTVIVYYGARAVAPNVAIVSAFVVGGTSTVLGIGTWLSASMGLPPPRSGSDADAADDADAAENTDTPIARASRAADALHRRRPQSTTE